MKTLPYELMKTLSAAYCTTQVEYDSSYTGPVATRPVVCGPDSVYSVSGADLGDKFVVQAFDKQIGGSLNG